jgi:uncharacterized hydantoinase/oxoprolinase family protein
MTSEELDFMIQEITMGTPKTESVVLMTNEAADAWDRLKVQIEEIKMRGNEVAIPFETPYVDVVDPAFMVDPVE